MNKSHILKSFVIVQLVSLSLAATVTHAQEAGIILLRNGDTAAVVVEDCMPEEAGFAQLVRKTGTLMLKASCAPKQCEAVANGIAHYNNRYEINQVWPESVNVAKGLNNAKEVHSTFEVLKKQGLCGTLKWKSFDKSLF